jgi:hypothetical protein
MRIAFVGNCQTAGMALATRHFLPEAEVAAFHVGIGPDAATIVERIAGFDMVFSHIVAAPGDPPPALSAEALAPHVDKAATLPPIAFTGFQPDMTYVLVDGKPIDGPLASYHSRIALGAYLAGCDEIRAQRLFNAHVFAALGYFDAYQIARNRLVRQWEEQGMDLRAPLRRLRARGTVFMHTVNHPTIGIIARATAIALARHGLLAREIRQLPDLRDELGESIVAPVFPAIAKRLGTPASDAFLQPIGWAAGNPREVPLADYIARSYRLYRRMPPERLAASNANAVAAPVFALLA